MKRYVKAVAFLLATWLGATGVLGDFNAKTTTKDSWYPQGEDVFVGRIMLINISDWINSDQK